MTLPGSSEPAAQPFVTGWLRDAPPLMDDDAPLAVLLAPPLTEAPFPLATLLTPPLTEAPWPLAVLLEIKWVMRCQRFMLRGTANVRGEWDLVCAAFNLRRLSVHAAVG
jgi:hypothetical protein